MKLSDHIYVERGGTQLPLAFTHVNPRHHSMALVQRPAIAPSGPRAKRLSHVMVETTSLDATCATIDLACTRGMTMGSLGPHANDRMVSVYVASPSGFNVEFSFDGLLIDDEATWNIRHYDAISIWGHQPAPQTAAP